jgi:hypothetical protein
MGAPDSRRCEPVAGQTSGFRANRPQDWPWSSVDDDVRSVNDARLTPSGLSVDRITIPADARRRI